MTAPALHAAPEIGTTPARTCLRCGGGAYAELREGCAHAFTLEELAPSPLVEVVDVECAPPLHVVRVCGMDPLDEDRRRALLDALNQLSTTWAAIMPADVDIVPMQPRTEELYLASHNGAAPRAIHPTEAGAREGFAVAFLWHHVNDETPLGAALRAWGEAHPNAPGGDGAEPRRDCSVCLDAARHAERFGLPSPFCGWPMRAMARARVMSAALDRHAREFAERHGMPSGQPARVRRVASVTDNAITYDPNTPPLGLAFYDSNADAIAAIDREIERAALGVEGETVAELAARLFDGPRREGDADITHGPGVRPWERGSTAPDPRDVVLFGRVVVQRDLACRCGADAWASFADRGVAGWYVCTKCRTAEPGEGDPLAPVPDALAAFEVHRRDCVTWTGVDTCSACGTDRWYVHEREPDGLCAGCGRMRRSLAKTRTMLAICDGLDQVGGCKVLITGSNVLLRMKRWPTSGAVLVMREARGHSSLVGSYETGEAFLAALPAMIGDDGYAREPETIRIGAGAVTERERGEMIANATRGARRQIGGVPLLTRAAPASVDIPPGGPETIDVWPIGMRVSMRQHPADHGSIQSAAVFNGRVCYRVRWDDGAMTTLDAEGLVAHKPCPTCRSTGDWGDGRVCADCEDDDA